ncbi:hypothetical protein D9613_004546 [Agrocybe pediades]|uniref:F-box domain-containing protein n=1 Tax=Agrocybe pediades TaxID=84607 RepID=A0A8H4QJ82_9AGAR|nr:hypothetical protein D9613_004546 [Agrocybe pediades]
MAHNTPSKENTIFNYYRSSVLRRMPPEIMTNIFQAFIDLNRQPAAMHYANKLASVCKTWYNIVMTSPSLWTNIYVFNHMVFAKGAHLVVKEWIQRSKALPINLFIPGDWHDSRDLDYLFRNGSREVLSNMVQLVTVLAESSHRWRAISFNISFHFIRRFCDMAQDLSQLRSVKYGYKCREWAGSLQWKKPLSLETVKIRFKLTSSLLETLNVPSDSLTRLSVKEMSVERCIETLRGSPVLRHLKTSLTDAVPIEDFVPPLPVVHEVLESPFLLATSFSATIFNLYIRESQHTNVDSLRNPPCVVPFLHSRF